MTIVSRIYVRWKAERDPAIKQAYAMAIQDCAYGFDWSAPVDYRRVLAEVSEATRPS